MPSSTSARPPTSAACCSPNADTHRRTGTGEPAGPRASGPSLGAPVYGAGMTRGNSCSRLRSVALVGAAVGSLLAGCSGSDGADDASVASSTTVGRAAPAADRVLSLKGGDAVATVDPRFQSYNIEMVEVTGGEFWKPYDAGAGKVVRPPIDLASERLRNLARALGPATTSTSAKTAPSSPAWCACSAAKSC